MPSRAHQIADQCNLIDMKYVAETLEVSAQKLKRMLKEEGVLQSVNYDARASLIAKPEFVKAGYFKNQPRVWQNPQYPGIKQQYLVAVPTAEGIDFIRILMHERKQREAEPTTQSEGQPQ